MRPGETAPARRARLRRPPPRRAVRRVPVTSSSSATGLEHGRGRQTSAAERPRRRARLPAIRASGPLAFLHSGGRCDPTLALRVVPDLLDEALVRLDAELDDDIDQQIEQALDVVACELAPALVLLHQQYQLLERQFGARRVHTGNGAGMAGIDVAQIIEGLFGPQLGE